MKVECLWRIPKISESRWKRFFFREKRHNTPVNFTRWLRHHIGAARHRSCENTLKISADGRRAKPLRMEKGVKARMGPNETRNAVYVLVYVYMRPIGQHDKVGI